MFETLLIYGGCVIGGGIAGFILGTLVYRNNVDVIQKTVARLEAKLTAMKAAIKA